MSSKKVQKMLYSILMTKFIVALALILVGCNTDFFQPDPEDDIRTKPIEQIDEDYLNKPVKTLPLAWENFGDRSIWSISEKKVISYDGKQRYPVLHNNRIAFVDDRGMENAGNFVVYEEIYVSHLDSSYNQRIASIRVEPKSWYQNDKVKLLRLKDDVLAWIEAGETQWEYNIYVKHLDQNGSSPKKIHTMNIGTSLDSTQLESLTIYKNYLFWSEPKQDKSIQVSFHDLFMQQTKVLTGVAASKFAIDRNWIVFTEMSGGRRNVVAQNLITGERLVLNSSQSQALDSVDISRDTAFWVDNRFTKTVLYAYDLKLGSAGREVFYLVTNTKDSSMEIKSKQNNLIYMKMATNAGYYVFDVRRLSVDQYWQGSRVKNFSCDGNRFLANYNNSLTPDNDDVFALMVPQ